MTPSKRTTVGLPGLLDELLRVLGESLAVVPLVVEDGDLLDLQLADGEIHLQAGLGVVGGDGPEEVGILAALGQVGIRGRGGHDDDPGVLVDAEGGLGRPAADVADDGLDVLGNQLGRRIGGHFRLADVVLDEELHLPAQDAALGVDLLDDHLRGLDRREAVGGEIAAVGAGHAELDRVGGEKGSGETAVRNAEQKNTKSDLRKLSCIK